MSNITIPKYCPVGETVEHLGKRVRAIEAPARAPQCTNCCFDGEPLASCMALLCVADDRPDEKNIVFVEVREND